MRRLETALQRYAWGKSGSDSMVAQLKKSEDSDFEVDEGETYAELWMGTHPNGPSRVMRDGHEGSDELQGLYGSVEGPGMFLIELLETHPHYLGDQESVGDLPFMFKVLSINKALSIQAHPDKKLAERLYATRPDLYKDDNHKPEMAVALSDFEGLCGFRPFREIVYHLKIYPELRAMIGAEATAKAFACTSGVREDEEEALRLLFRAFVTANTDVVTVQVNALVERLRSSGRRPRPGETPSSSRSSRDVIDEGGAGDCGSEAGVLDGPFEAVSHGARNDYSRSSYNERSCRCDSGSSSSGCSKNNDASGGSLDGADLLSCEGSCHPLGHSRCHKSDPGRRCRNACDIFVEGDGEGEEDEDGEERDEKKEIPVVVQTRRTELSICGLGGGGIAKELMDVTAAGGIEDTGSGDFAGAEERMLHIVADGGSDDTADSAGDGVTDHEDVHVEDESRDDHRLDPRVHPKTDGNKRPSDTISVGNSASTSTTGSNSTDTSSNNSSSSNISTGAGTSTSEKNVDIVDMNHRDKHVDVSVKIIPRGKHHPALVRHGAAAAVAAAATAARGGAPPAGAFRRRGWSSSKLAFPDITGHRRDSEDLALRELILRLAAEYPGDIGIMMPLLLNYLRMGEGESFFMAANEPHAYLKGDILEVMARSDNVVRVALTPKHRDVPLLCEILTYHMGAPPIVTPVVVDDCCSRYSPPIKDFEMLDIEVPHGQEYATPPVPVAALAIVMAGNGFACDGNGRQRLCRGVAVFVPAKTPVVYSNTDIKPVGGTGGESLWVCMARSNLYHYMEGEECCY